MNWKKARTIGIIGLMLLITVTAAIATKSLRNDPTEIQVDKANMEKAIAKELARFETKHPDHVTEELTIERDPNYGVGEDMIIHSKVLIRAIE